MKYKRRTGRDILDWRMFFWDGLDAYFFIPDWKNYKWLAVIFEFFKLTEILPYAIE